MPGSSPPTRRVIDIVELLIERGGAPARLSDIVSALDLNQATAHMIMKELVAAGWATRDPIDKTFTVGMALARLAAQIDQPSSVVHAAHAVAQSVAAEGGYAASVSERVGHQLVITAFIAAPTGHDTQWRAAVGDRLPFAAPFGPAYAAWESRDERLAWIERSGVLSRAFQLQLEEFLDDTARQGFSVERMSPEMVSAIPVMTKLQTEALSDSMRDNLDNVLLEMTGPATNSAGARGQRNYVGAISVPVFGQSGRVTHSITVHPFTNLSSRKIDQLGRSLRRAAAAIGGQPA
ncbi:MULTISPECIES: helix-turn-helix domain-containing protein [unclassified Mycobacterium]|uniref:helix-turn-helix domain-containing protein n=1 Tax=unclassified Mycobacterium TaxID=2642494 RepID=UPI0004910AB9|nr:MULTISPECIES: helix-turn-helix domain-containing protein [unclassified Mycobacterium]SEA39349.1 DNA-binding transcriptional regulator, IclR family [Mycobacterium sp. 283mftsu]